jgi:hypothetical protein
MESYSISQITVVFEKGKRIEDALNLMHGQKTKVLFILFQKEKAAPLGGLCSPDRNRTCI